MQDRDAADVTLMRRVVLGDGAALGALMEGHWRKLVAYATHLLGDSDAAHDVVQQAFTRLWETRSDWKPSASVRAFLHRMVRNGAIDELRRRAVRSFWRGRDELLPPAPVTPYDATQSNELRRAIQGALRSLPARRREVFVLAHLQGLSYREIAATLSVSQETVKKHVALALRDLRRLLADHLPDSMPASSLDESREHMSEAAG
jgi:RNA polymerase sigma-70 factor (ECF subfamily)